MSTGNKQLDFMWPYPVPEGMHPYAPLLIKPLGFNMDIDLINDLCRFLFDLVGVKLHDQEPTTVEYSRGWDDSREVDELVPGGSLAAVWCPVLPPGLSLDPRTGLMKGTLPEGVWSWTVHVGPQIKFDALGGVGSPNEDGRWIGALEERQGAVQVVEDSAAPIDVSKLTAKQRALLLAELQKNNSDEKGSEE